MGASATYCRPIRRTTDGYFLQRPTTVNSITVAPGGYDVKLDLYDGDAGGQVIYTIEADNAASSSSINFNPPMIFKNKIYGKFISDGPANLVSHSATITVLEPAEAL